MALNPSIILAGQPVNVLAQLDAGTQAGMRANLAQQQNRQTNVFAQHGAAALGGDQNALEQIAGVDFGTANTVQQQGVQNARAERQLGLSERAADRQDAAFSLQLEQYAASKTAAERAAEVQEIEGAVAAGLATQTPEQWDALMQQLGQPELVGQFEQREALGAKMLSVADSLKRFDKQNETPEPADEYGRYVADEQAAGRQPLNRIDYAQAKKGVETIYGPDGQPILQRGPASAKTDKLSEKQSQLALFGTMMDKTMPVINDLEERFDPSNLKDNVAARAGWAGNAFKSNEMQKYETAARAWAEGVLRLQTGAAATQPEIERVFSTYFAQPGDSPETVQYKREIRDAFAQSIGVASSGLVNPGQGGGDDLDFNAMDAEAFGDVDLDSLSQEQMEAMIARGKELGL